MDAIKDFFGKLAEKWRGLSGTVRIVMIVSLVALIAVVIIFAVSGGGGGNSPELTPMPTPSSTPTPIPTPSSTPTPTPDLHPGEARSNLTGEWVAEEVINQRPYAVMFNNIEMASPQSGTGDAAIIYEALTEAGITRLMAIYENLSSESSLAGRIGSVRSARHYYASFADAHDAIFIHYGETKYATKKIDELGLDDIDGISWIGDTVFYRDTTIKAPHNAFATLEGIEEAVEKLGYRTEHREDYTSPFDFLEEEADLESEMKAEKIVLSYSNYMAPYLVYDSEKKLYNRYQFGSLHTDYNTGEPLQFKNVIIQIVEESNIDKNGYQTMEIEDNEGKGYYITNGFAIPITWKKNEQQHFMCYYDADGNTLRMNPGKTFISVYPDFREDRLSISPLEEENTGE